MKKIYQVLFIMSMLLGVVGCTATVEQGDIRIVSQVSNEEVTKIELFSGEEENYFIQIDSTIAVTETRVTSSNNCIEITTDSSGFKVTALGGGTSEVTIELTAEKYHPYTMVIPVTVALKEQEIVFSDLNNLAENVVESELKQLSLGDIAISKLSENTKEILRQRLAQGEVLTQADLVEDELVSFYQDDYLMVTVGSLAYLDFLEEDAEYTLTTEDSHLLTVEEYNGEFTIVPLAEGTGVLRILMEREHYQSVEREITVEVKDPIARVYLFEKNYEIEVDEATELAYYVYPPEATVEIVSLNESICVVELTNGSEEETEEETEENSSESIQLNAKILGVAVGQGEVVITASEEGLRSYSASAQIQVTPIKTKLEVASSVLADDMIVLNTSYPENLDITMNENAELLFVYDEDCLEIEKNGSEVVVTSLKEGEFTLEIIAKEDGYDEHSKIFNVVSTKAAVNLSVGSTSATVEGTKTTQLTVKSTTTGANINVSTTDGVAATLSGSTLNITATKDGTITLEATESNHITKTTQIKVTYQKESIVFSNVSTSSAITGTESKTISINTSVDAPTITVSTSGGVSANYNASTKSVTITATSSGTVTLTAAKDGYQTTTHKITVTYSKPSLNLSVSTSSLSIEGTESKTASVTVDTGSTIAVSSSGGATAKYDTTSKVITITSTSSGTVTVTATKDGYQTDTKTINITYVKPTLKLSVSSSSAAITGTGSQTVNVSVEDGATVSVTTTGGASATYNSSSKSINITATSAGTVSVSASKSGYDNESVTISVSYQAPIDTSSYANQVVTIVNQERAAVGLPALTVSSNLMAGAAIRAEELVDLFSHTRPDGSSWSTVSSEANGENIAYGQTSPSNVMTSWMNSQGHKENILRSSFKTIGVGVYYHNGRYYWVQLFGY